MEKIPTDNRIRSMLDEVSPDALQRCFDHVVEQLRERDGLKAFQRLAGRILVTLDGTEYFCSQKLSCPQCLTRKRTNGKTEHYHAMLAAVIVAPGQNMVLPLMPEFITPQDGAEKQDCERNGANLAHNFGHGKKYLARIFAAMNLLALAFHTACDCLETLWQQAREAKGTRTRFFGHIRTISAYVVFPSWHRLMNTLISCKVVHRRCRPAGDETDGIGVYRLDCCSYSMIEALFLFSTLLETADMSTAGPGGAIIVRVLSGFP